MHVSNFLPADLDQQVHHPVHQTCASEPVPTDGAEHVELTPPTDFGLKLFILLHVSNFLPADIDRQVRHSVSQTCSCEQDLHVVILHHLVSNLPQHDFNISEPGRHVRCCATRRQ